LPSTHNSKKPTKPRRKKLEEEKNSTKNQQLPPLFMFLNLYLLRKTKKKIKIPLPKKQTNKQTKIAIL